MRSLLRARQVERTVPLLRQMKRIGRLLFSILLLLMAATGLLAIFVDGELLSSTVFGLLLLLFAVLVLLFWLGALVSAIRNPNLADAERIGWILVIVFLSVPGALIYILFAKPDFPRPGTFRDRSGLRRTPGDAFAARSRRPSGPGPADRRPE